MLPLFKNPLIVSIVLATTLGVLAHDTQIDQAAIIAVAVPASFTAFVAADSFKSNEHVHVEKVSVMSQVGASRLNVPKIQPRDDDHQYVQTKKHSLIGGDTTGLWPSV
ncbi:MAG TPA: hypothetical protein VIM37_03165 [Candidatus Microsaccharimonas sp.]|jgi:recombinational DNA repair protein RecR